jgi:hypothetical protein
MNTEIHRQYYRYDGENTENGESGMIGTNDERASSI